MFNGLFINKIILAPMAGITDLPFRLLCREQGCDMVYTEMVSAKGMMYNMNRSEPLLVTDPKERPVGVQIFGSEPEIMSKEAAILAERDFDFVIINAPLKDDLGMRFAIDCSTASNALVLFLR